MAAQLPQKTDNPARANHRFARAALLFVVLLLLAGLLRLSVNGDPSRLLGSNSDRYQTYASVLDSFPGEQNQVLIYTQAQALDPEHLAAYKSVIKPLSNVAGVAAVSSLYSSSNLGKALDRVTQNPAGAQASGVLADVKALLSQPDYLLSRLVSGDFDALLMSVTLNEDANPTSTIAKIESILAAAYPAELSISWSLAGNPVIAQVLSQDTLLELLRVTSIAMVLGIGVAGWVFRNVRVVVQVVSVPIVAVACTLGLMGWLGIALNLLTQSVLVVVFLVVFSDALHAIHGGRSQRSLLLACALTSVTTAASAAALLFARSTVIQEFGFALLAGIAAGFLVWVLWLLAGFHKTNNAGVWPASIAWPQHKNRSRFGSIATLVLAIVVLFIPASQLRPGFSLFENIPKAHQSVQALTLAENQFSGYLPLQVMIENVDEKQSLDEFLQSLRSLQNRLNEQQLGSISNRVYWYSVTDVLALTPGFSNRHRLRVLPQAVRQSLWNNAGSAVLFAPHSVIDVMRASPEFLSQMDEAVRAAASDEGLTASVITGLPALVQEASQKIFPDAVRSVLITLLVLSFVVVLVLKSWRLAFIAALPVVLGVLGFAATLVLLNEPLRHAGVVMLTLVIGLSIDNALHLIVSAKHDAVHPLRAIERCMPVLWVATMAIVAGFIALTFSHIPSVSTLGVATAGALAISFIASAIWIPHFLEA